MAEETRRIQVGDGSVSAVYAAPEGAPKAMQFVYAPGAGSNLNDGFGVFACRELAKRGYATWRFQFPYMEAGKKAPDRPPVLEATWNAVLEAAKQENPVSGIVAGGRSMGGRIASQVVASGTEVRGLALFAYPLNPPGRANAGRAEHLPRITVPVLFCSGTRDAFGTPDELQKAAALIPGSKVRFLEGASHGFDVMKASGRSRTDVWREAAEALLAFLGEIEAMPPS